MTCTSCQKEMSPFVEFDMGAGAQQKCPLCFAVQAQPKIETVVKSNSDVAQKVEHQSVKLGDAGSTPAVRAKLTRTNLNIVALAKQRLREVKQELRRLKALQKEKGELERLIAAAKQKKPAAVTHLRAAK